MSGNAIESEHKLSLSLSQEILKKAPFYGTFIVFVKYWEV